MTLGDLAKKARRLCGINETDTTTYPDADLLFDINLWYQKVAMMIFESQDDSDWDDARNTNYPIQTTPLVAAQRDYNIPVTEKVLKIKRVDVTYDGINWYRATPLDDGTLNLGLGNDTNTDANFVKSAPRYDVKFNSVFIYPTATASDVSSGAKIRVEWYRQVTEFTSSDYTSVLTDSTVIPGFDDPWHPLLAYGAAYEYCVSKNSPQLVQVSGQLADYEQRLRNSYGKKQLDTRMALGSAYDNAYGL